MPTVVTLPFKIDGGRVTWGSFERFLIDWDECSASTAALEDMARDSGRERGVIRFENNEPVEVQRG